MSVKLPTREELLRAALLKKIQKEAGARGDRNTREVIPKVDRNRPLPLSFAQQRLWFIAQLDSAASGAYHIPAALRLTGKLDRPALRAALDRLMARQEGLRTRFVLLDGVPHQVIAPDGVGFALIETNLMHLAEDMREQAVMAECAEESRASFDLAAGPMIRGRLLRLAEDEHVLLVTQHHLISDGWSIGVLVREVAALYEAASQGAADSLPALDIQYADYAAWQRDWLKGEELQRQLGFWREHLTGAPALLTLPVDRARPAMPSYAGAQVPIRISKELSARVRTLAQRHGVTDFMTLLAAWSVLMARLSDQNEVVIGTPVANRQRREVEGLIGFFVNTLALRVRLESNPSVRELLAQVKGTALAAFGHQELPFDQVVDAVQPARSLSYSPLFQSVFIFDKVAVERTLTLPGVSLTPLDVPRASAHFDLSLALSDSEEGYSGEIEYASDLFERATVERFVGHFVTLIEGMVASDDAHVAALPLLTVEQERQLLVDFNDTALVLPDDAFVHEQFEAQVAARPDAIAATYENQSLSYAELNARANRLAHYLISQGVGPDVCVAICLERSLDMMVGILGVLKAGGAYVPLDPTYPRERLAYVLADSAPKMLLIQQAVRERLPSHSIPTLALDAAEGELAAQPTTNSDARRRGLASGHLIYVIYTSGSTGMPKGVAALHQGVLNYFHHALQHYLPEGAAGAVVTTPFNFDSSITTLITPLLCGKQLVLLPDENHHCLTQLHEYCRQTTPWLFSIAPAHLEALVEMTSESPSLTPHILAMGGELLTWRGLQKFRERVLPNAIVFNEYGPTETSVACTMFDCDKGRAASNGDGVPIGRPIANMKSYVLNNQRVLTPIGVPGELYAAGVGIARSFLNRPELTAERFLEDPFSDVPGARMYKTGDIVRWLPDGNLEFISRNDFQVKIRGFRVELGEIEATLARCAGVGEAAVLAREDALGNKRLVAYLSAKAGAILSAAILREELAAQLPDYMVPGAFVVLDAFPLTPNGKLDRHALPVPEDNALVRRQFEPPRGEIEEVLAAIWQKLLGVESVGRHDHFFQMGGHSLLTVQLAFLIEDRLGIEVPLRELFEHAELDVMAQHIAGKRGQASLPPLTPAARDGRPLPLSFAQQRLWFIAQMDPAASAAYHMPAALRLTGKLDRSVLQAALDRVMARQEGLRVRFVTVDGVPHQVMAPTDVGFALTEKDLSHLAHAEHERTVAEEAAESASAPFDLATGPLIRGRLLRLSQEEHVLLIAQHHLVTDGWSVGVMVREVATLYAAFSTGEADPLPALEFQYADYAAWQRQWLQGEELERQIDFWRGHLHGAPPLLTLPTDRARPSMPGYQGGMVRLDISPELTARLRALSQRHGVTLFMTLMAGWSVLLARLSGQQDVVIGTPVANRQRREVESVIGFFVNTLALRVRLDDNPSVRDLLAQVKASALEAFSHQELPFDQVVEALHPVRSLGYSPLFQVMLAMDNTPDSELALQGGLALPGLTMTPLATPHTTAHFDLSLLLSDDTTGLTGELEYACDLFDRATIERFATHFLTLLEGMAANDAMRVGTLPLLTQAEQDRVLVDFNDVPAEKPSDSFIHEQFEACVAAHPDATALVFESQSLSYAELNARANRVAHYLIAHGVHADDRVVICTQRTPDLVIAMLGVLKAGGAYVPLDPAYPIERLQYLLTDSAPKALLIQQAQRERISSDSIPTLVLDASSDELSAQPEQNPDSRGRGLAAHHLAYVIYTSGSTGLPKGVMVHHEAALNYLDHASRTYLLDDMAGALVSTPFSFDATLTTLVTPLLCGKQVVLLADENHRCLMQLLAYCQQSSPWLLKVTPAHLEALAGMAATPPRSTPHMIVVGGEQLTWRCVEKFRERVLSHAVIVNEYGPTETAVGCTVYASHVGDAPALASAVSIGRPIANTKMYILDQQGAPVPIGVAGELYIGGVGVARGYLNRAELTAARFLKDPFSDAPSARMYKTGDLVRWLPDGNIEFLGRNDFQVKIRGLRIELGEIEAKLAACAGVREAAVLAREDSPGDKRLVAYFTAVAGAHVSTDDLRSELRAQLPDYMVPSVFVMLDAFDLTANGKLDRKALPMPDSDALDRREYEAPHTGIEVAMAEIWQQLLGVARVGRHDNFFELGGHSLLAARVVSELRSRMGAELALRSIFERPTLRELAATIERAPSSAWESVLPTQRDGRPLPLSFAQRRLWVIDQLDPDNQEFRSQYNIPMALRLQGKLDQKALTLALNGIVDRHEILRTVYVNDSAGEGVQIIKAAHALEVRVIELPQVAQEEQEQRVHALALADGAKVFDLTRDPVLRATLVRLDESHHVLLLNLHHIAGDGWSMAVLAREFMALYAAHSGNASSTLPVLPVQYADFAQWQRRQLSGDSLRRMLAYWTQQLADLPVVHSFPLDKKRPEKQSVAGALVSQSLGKHLGDSLIALGRRQDCTLFMLMQAAFSVLLGRYSGESDIVIGTPVANRPGAELAPMIGFFLNTLVLRNDLSGNPDFTALLARSKEMVLGAYEHQHVPFEMLVDALRPERTISHTPLFQVMFTVQNNDSVDLTLADLNVRILDFDRGIAKYDLSLSIAEHEDGMRIDWEYCTDLFERDTIVRLAENFEVLLQAITAAPETPIDELALLGAAERQTLLRTWNDSACDYPRAQLVHEAFELQAQRTPDAPAVSSETGSLSYRELDERADRLAHYLRNRGLQEEARVGVCIERSPEMLVALLATLKAGAAYVPLDPGYPLERLHYMLHDSGASWLLTQSDVVPMFSVPAHCQTLCLDEPDLWADLSALLASEASAVSTLGPANLAYLIYTSGSTGKPKGVMIEHRNVINFFTGLDQRLGVSVAAQTWLAVTSISFDISVLELFWTLSRGHHVVLQAERPMPVAEIGEIDFSLFYFAAEDSRATNKYQLLLDGARFADSHGLAGVWVPERHFANFGDPFPNPSIAAAAIAAVTRNVPIRSGSVVLPLHDPIRVAEEWSMVDNISDGRVELSIASGWHPNDFIFAPQNYAKRYEVMKEGIDTLCRFWRGEGIERTNGVGKPVTVHLHPKPIQAALPIWITAGGSPETFRYAGSIGANVLTHLLGQSEEALSEKITIYRRARAEAGFDAGRIALMLHTFVGEDAESVKQAVEQPLKNYFRQSLDLLKPLAEQAGLDVGTDVDALLALGFEHHFARSGLFGTVESCCRRAQELRRLGIDEIACLIDFGVEHADVVAYLPLLKRMQSSLRQQSAQQRLLAKRLEKSTSPFELIQRHRVTHMQCTPSYARELVIDEDGRQALGGLRQLLVGGEALPTELANALEAVVPGQIFNMYGPTETTIWSSVAEVSGGDVHLGKPLANTQLYVVNGRQQLSPTGAVGELLIAGDGVARGYFEREALTRERFLANPFAGEMPEHGGRVYRTGDSVRRSADGRLQYVGRIDHQVKLRGHRIELGEIESTLSSHAAIAQVVVIARGEPKQLIAYVVAKASTQAIASDVLKSYLRQHLPEIMVPSAIVTLAALPLTPNGKIDRKALPDPEMGGALQADYVAPQSLLEEELCALWQSVLGLERVGVTDNFFSIGGDSILAIRLIARCTSQGIQVTVQQLIQHQTIRELAPHARQGQGVVQPQEAVTGAQALLPIQRWFLGSDDAIDQHHYNQSVLLTVTDTLDEVQLASWVTALHQRHDALRLRFIERDGVWHGEYRDFNPAMVRASIAFEDLRDVNEAEWGAQIACIGERMQASLSLSDGPLFRAVMFEAGAGFRRLLLIAHHLIIDGVSWRVLLSDLEQGYRQLREGRGEVMLAKKRSSLQAWGHFLEQHARSQSVRNELDYWQAQLTVPPLPIAAVGVVDQSYGTTRVVSFELDADDTDALLKGCHRAYRTETPDLLLAAVLRGFQRWGNVSTLLFSMEGHGREALSNEIDHSETVGWLTSLYPLALRAPITSSVGDLIMHVKEQMRAVPAKGIGYGLLRHLAGIESLAPSTPRNDILFNYLGQFDQSEADGIAFATEFAGHAVSPRRQREHGAEITALISGGRLSFGMGFNGLAQDAARMQALLDDIHSALKEIIAYCLDTPDVHYTPSDFPLAQATLAQVRQWQQTYPDLQQLYASTAMQQGLIFHELVAGGAYVTQLDLSLVGELDQALFRSAWQRIIERHDIFRTIFVGDRLVQLVRAHATVNWQAFDWRDLDVEAQVERFLQYSRADKKRGFDLTQAPLLRLAVMRLTETRTRLLVSYHHALMDAWSQMVLFDELMQVYRALLHERVVELPAPVPYSNYVAWLAHQDRAAAHRYWQQRVGDIRATTELGLAGASAHSTAAEYDEQRLHLGVALTQQLQAFARTHHLTTHVLIQGAWGYLVHRYSGRDCILFGETISGRPATLPNVERVVGLFINTLPVRMEFAADVEVVTWLQRLHRESVEREAFAYMPLLDIQALSDLPRGQPLFETLLAFNNLPEPDAASTGQDLRVEALQGDEQTNYGLTLSAQLLEDLSFRLTYRTDRYASATLDTMLGHFREILSGIADAHGKTVSQLPLLTRAEEEQAQVRRLTSATRPDAQDMEEGTETLLAALHDRPVYVLDGKLRHVPPGVTGELYSAQPDGRLEPTGELARWLAGRLELLGRVSDQVCIQGHTFGLAQVRRQLQAWPGLRETCVLCSGDGDRARLVAWLVPEQMPERELEALQLLQRYLQDHLPEAVVPAGFKMLPALPRLLDGQVDVQRLPEPHWLETLPYVAPETPTERALAAIWEELLERPRIGALDSVFALGGNSLTAVRLEFAIQERFGVQVTLRELFENAELRAQALVIEAKERQMLQPGIERVPRDHGPLPLSFAQQRLWFIDQMDRNSNEYNMPLAIRLHGRLDLHALQVTLDAIVDRHEILRTSYQVTESGEPHQVIHAPTPLQIDVLTGSSTEEGLRAQVAAEAMKPFDLSFGQMLRASILRLSDTEHVLLMTTHHIASDGASMGVLIDEFVQLYGAFARGGGNPLPPLSLQYADFVHWQQGWLHGETLERQVSYWTRQLAGIPSLHGLPTDKSRPASQSFAGATLRRPIDQALRTQLQALGQAHGTTLFMTLQAAFAALLARYSNETDIVIGTPIANRAHPALASVIGLFVNTLVLRNEVTMDASFASLLEQTRQLALDAYEHQDVPFEMLVSALHPERSLSHSPVFQVMFALQENLDPELALPGLRVDTVDTGYQVAKFDLSLTIDTTEDGLLGSWEYCVDLFEADSIARLAESFELLLRAVVAQPEQPVGDVPLLTATQQDAMLTTWCGQASVHASGRCTHEVFEALVRAQPDALSVTDGQQSLTYGELNQRANQWAHHLAEQGVGPDVLVGICVERSLDAIVAIMAVMKAGGGYVPLDPNYPWQRLEFMLKDSGVHCLLTQTFMAEKLRDSNALLLFLDAPPEAVARSSRENPQPRAWGLTSRNTAYMIYTSGSTGEPKGALITHDNVVAYCEVARHDYGAKTDDRVLQFSTLSFDMFMDDFSNSLLTGGALVLRNDDILAGPRAFCQFVKEHRISVASLSTAFWHELCFSPAGLEALNESDARLLIIGGEAMSKAAVHQWQSVVSPKVRVLNTYGPTECTVTASCFDVERSMEGYANVPIGRPTRHVRAYVLNVRRQLAAIGEVGELHIGGPGVGAGYFNRPELTAQRFIQHTFPNGVEERLYRTGDLVCWSRDGELEYMGRIDHQVKVRGFRVETGEVESVLRRHAEVKDVVVVARGKPVQLVAYVVAEQRAGLASEWRALLRSQLPEFMVPSAFVVLDAIPLLPNGKRNLKALPDVGDEHAGGEHYTAPGTPTEARICALWEDLLKLKRVSIHDNFFELGGHSLLATRMVSALRQQFDLDIPLREVFNLQTVFELSAYIDEENELARGLDGIGSEPASEKDRHSSAEVWEL
ncbi:non-ribosomal peptide synthase/polyketide synthase [Xanthomonas sp. NCPPB 3582]|uniref:non-ribosomal peptide synthase/polyketide synthase n=1 Tax=Xanthomonas sp. NCPPB 3582 TaxID=487557 RepID=UPI0035581D05